MKIACISAEQFEIKYEVSTVLLSHKHSVFQNFIKFQTGVYIHLKYDNFTS